MSVDFSSLPSKAIEFAEINWLYHTGEKAGTFEVYQLINDSLKINTEHKSIRMKFKGSNINTDDPFELILTQKEDKFYFKSDTYDIPEEEHECYLYETSDEVLFYAANDNEEVYLHMEIKS